MKTIWLLDVDGVINASRAGWSAAPRVVDAYHMGRLYRIRFEPKLLQGIQAIHDAGEAEVRWATTWNDNPGEMNRVLPFGPFEHAFGPRLSDHPNLTHDELKIFAARDVLAAGHRLVWTDDSVVPVARNRHPEFVRAEATGQALLIAPSASRGLRPDDQAIIETFLISTTWEDSLPKPLASS